METLSSLVEEWNATVDDSVQKVEDYNKEVTEKFHKGEVHAKALMQSLQIPPKKLKCPSRSWARWWRAQFGWTMLTRGTSDSQWLPYHHADMVASRMQTRKVLEEECHGGLMLNMDQLWRASWSTSKFKMAYKPRKFAGGKAKKGRHGPRLDKKIHCIKGARRSVTVSWLKIYPPRV